MQRKLLLKKNDNSVRMPMLQKFAQSLLKVFAKSCKIRFILEKVNNERSQNVVRVGIFEYCCKMWRFKHIRPRHEETERYARRKLLKKSGDKSVRMMECSDTEDAFVLLTLTIFVC